MLIQLMTRLAASDGADVVVEEVELLQGNYAKLQPSDPAFRELTAPKAQLETALRKFPCLTRGQSIVIPLEGRQYEVAVLDTQPCSAILSSQTDLEVEIVLPAAPAEETKEEPPRYDPRKNRIAKNYWEQLGQGKSLQE